ncbi:hypothetical protein IMG5_058910, partial [Ichthyophthirius multifiliis]
KITIKQLKKEKFKEISEAYKILSVEVKRKEYDQMINEQNYKLKNSQFYDFQKNVNSKINNIKIIMDKENMKIFMKILSKNQNIKQNKIKNNIKLTKIIKVFKLEIFLWILWQGKDYGKI